MSMGSRELRTELGWGVGEDQTDSSGFGLGAGGSFSQRDGT